MKQIVKFSLVTLLWFSASVVAWTAEDPVDDSIDQVRKEIIQLLAEPNMQGMEKSHVTSTLHFTINNKNELVVLMVDSEDDFADRFLKHRLNYKKVTTSKVRGQYAMKITLKNGSR